MKKLHKTLIGAGFAFILSLFGLSACKDYQYIQKIPKKYLLDGNYENSDGDFDYYKITTEAYKDQYAVSLKDGVTNRDIKIPEKYHETDVVGIYRNGFSDLKNLNITIPSSIQVIDYEAFMSTEFTNTSFSIPYTVKKLGTASFFGTNIKSLVFSDGESQVEGVCQAPKTESQKTTATASKITEIPDFCFANCKDLTSITYSNSLKTICTEAFENCSRLKLVAFLSGLDEIQDKAFNNCSSLTSVYIPLSIVNTTKPLGDFVFAHCNASLNYYINIEESKYKSFQDSHKFFLRQSEYSNGNYKWSPITGDVYANGSWLYNVQILKDETKETINLMKFIGNLPSDGTMAFPNQINGKTVTTFSYDCVLAYEKQIEKMYLPKYLEEIPDNFLRGDDKNSNYYSDLSYVGSMSENNCYKESTETGVIDLSGLSDLHTIGQYSFKLSRDNDRDKFKKIALPENLVEIKKEAFGYFKNVTDFKLDDTGRNTTKGLIIRSNAFYALGRNKSDGNSKIILPKDTTSIENSAFEEAYCIKELTIHGDSITDLAIGEKAFKNCLYLEKVTIEEHNKVTLNTQCFANWTDRGDYLYLPGLQYVYLPKNTTLNGTQLFDRQNRLTIYSGDPNLTIKNPGSTLGQCFDDEAPRNPDNSDTLSHKGTFTYFGFRCIPNVYKNVKLTAPSANDNASQLLQDGNLTYLLTTNENNDNTAILTKYHFDMRKQNDKAEIELTVPEKIYANQKDYTVTEIGDNAFANDDSYTDIFPNKQTPGNSENTYRTISKITLPDTITKIGDYAFFRCVGLHEINMPTSLESIGTHAFSFSGIKQLTNLNDDCHLAGEDDTSQSSPFLNCPNLASIILKKTENTAKLIVNNQSLKKANGDIFVVYPGYKPNNEDEKSFTFSSISTKFHFGAFRGVGWIEKLTISSSNFPKFPSGRSGDKGQALFTGFNSEKEIREKCCYKGSIEADGSTLTNDVKLKELNLKLGNDNTLSIPEGALLQTTISTVILPYGGGNGRIPSYLLNNIQTPKNGLVIKVQKYSANSTEYTNPQGSESGFLDLTDCGYTSIGKYAFYKLKNLREVKLDGIKEIQDNAFQDTGLTKVVFPSSLESIGTGAFQDSKNLQSISFPKDSLLNTIGSSAFNSCSLTGELKLPKNLSTMLDSAFCNNPNITKVDFSENENLKTIPSKAFEKSSSLTKIIFPTNLQTISDFAFHESRLQNVTIPKTVTSIGNYAFQSCQNMDSLAFEESNEENLTLGQYAFSGCSSLRILILNRSMEVGSSCFTGCASLQQLTIANDRSKEISIKDNAFSGFIHLSSVTFGSSLKEIGTSAFQGTGITEADLSNCTKLTSVKGFDNCKNLTKVILPDGCTEIGDRCFSNCSSLKTIESGDDKTEGKVVLSEKVNRIGNNAFEGCSLVTSIRCNTTTGMTIGDSAFKNCTGLTQFVQLKGTLTYSSQVIFECCNNLKYIVLPDQFVMESTGPLVKGLTQFSSVAYICINRAYQSFGTSIPAWAKINDTSDAKVAFASFGVTRPDNTYLWKMVDDTITVTGKNG